MSNARKSRGEVCAGELIWFPRECQDVLLKLDGRLYGHLLFINVRADFMIIRPLLLRHGTYCIGTMT